MTRTMEAAGVMAVVVMAALATVAADLNTNVQFLTVHNNERRAVGITALKWSDGIQKYAEDYVWKVGCTAPSSNPGGPYGWNLYHINYPVGFTEAVKEWVNEKRFYHYSTNTCDASHVCNHYTQIVWKKTVYVGCAYYLCGNGGRFVACAYYPPGNTGGLRPY